MGQQVAIVGLGACELGLKIYHFKACPDQPANKRDPTEEDRKASS